MSPNDHLIITVLGARRARAHDPRSAPGPVRDPRRPKTDRH